MQGHLDETEFIFNRHSEDEQLLRATESLSVPLLQQLKTRLFSVFFRVNTLRSHASIRTHFVQVLIETLQLLSLVLVDGRYSSMGPYREESPWNLGQTQWLIDVCWVVRVDRYFKSSLTDYVALLSIWVGLGAAILGLGALLSFLPKINGFTTFLTKALKVLMTLLCNILFIPLMDSLVFGMRCSVSASSECLDLPQGYQYLAAFVIMTGVLLSLAVLCSLLYYDMCLVCGGLKSKPHPRIKALRQLCILGLIVVFYFASTSAALLLFLFTSLALGLLLSYLHTQYMPYHHLKVCKLRQASVVAFTSAVFCMLIGEFFKTTDQTNSSVTMLFYFLTPCLIQITQLALVRRGKSLRDRKIQHLSNIYQVEIKARMHVIDIEEARSRSAKSSYRIAEDDLEENFASLHNRSLREIEVLFLEAFKKFPNAEWLYLWSGALQLHMFESYVLAMVQCFKGKALAHKLDSQYAFFHFARTSASCYKQFMKDDAYDYVLFERCFASALTHDEIVTKSQLYFWSELEMRVPKVEKLTKLAGEIATVIGITRTMYQRLIKLNPKSTLVLCMYGEFLKSLNNFGDIGERYIQRARVQKEAQGKGVNATVLSALSQPLSFFDSDNLIVTVSGDFETLGEVLNVNEAAHDVLGYLKAELVGRNISLIIPSPFAETHDEYMRKFHENGSNVIVDNASLLLYFVNKLGHLVECRTLVKVVPGDAQPPFLMAVILPTNPTYNVLLLNNEYYVTGASQFCEILFDLGSAKTSDLRIDMVMTNFATMKERIDKDEYLEARMGKAHQEMKCALSKLSIGRHHAYVLKVQTGKVSVEAEEVKEQEDEGAEVLEAGRQISTLKQKEVSSSSSSESEESDNSSDSQARAPVFPSETSSKRVTLQEEAAASESSEEISEGRSESEQEQVSPTDLSPQGSFVSLIQFNKAVKALVSHEFSRTAKYVRRFQLTLLLTILLLITTSILTFYVIRKAVEYNQNLAHFVNLVGDMRLQSVSLAYYIRIITLIDTGFVPASERERYLAWLSEDLTSMHEVHLKLYRNYDLLGDEDLDMYVEDTIPTWLMEAGVVRLVKTNLFDATAGIILQAHLVKQQSKPPLKLTNRRAFYIYRNGEGELLTSLNTSAHFFIRSARANISKESLTAILLIMASAMVLVFCATFAIIPALGVLEKSKREVWEIFLEIPTYVCRVMKGRCSERLNELNENADLDLEESKPQQVVEEEKEVEEAKPDNSPTTRENEKDKRNAAEKDSLRLSYDPRHRKTVIAKLASFFLVSVVYFYLIYYTGFDTIGGALEEEPVTIDWASRRKQLSRSVNFWVLESLVENITGLGLKDAVPAGQNLASTLRAATWATNELEYVENSLIFGNAEEGLSFNEMRGAVHDALMFSDACTAPLNRSLPDCSTVGNQAMKQGLHSALGMYVTLSRTILQTMTSLSSDRSWSFPQAQALYQSEDMKLLRDLDEKYLYDPLRYSSQLYESDYESHQGQMATWQNLLVSLYSVFVVMFFIFVANPAIHRIGHDTRNSWSLCTIAPQEYQEELKRLNVAIKTRRGSFKWR